MTVAKTPRQRGAGSSNAADIRAAVLQAGVRELVGHGLVRGMPRLTHGRLATRAHCAPSSVYRHWPDKAELASAVLAHLVDSAVDRRPARAGLEMVRAAARSAHLGDVCRAGAVQFGVPRDPEVELADALEAHGRWNDAALAERLAARRLSELAPLAVAIGRLAAVYRLRPVHPAAALTAAGEVARRFAGAPSADQPQSPGSLLGALVAHHEPPAVPDLALLLPGCGPVTVPSKV